VASGLVRSPPGPAVDKVRALAAGRCVVSLGKAVYSHSASLLPGVYMGTDKFNAGSNPAMFHATETMRSSGCKDHWPDADISIAPDQL